MNGQSVGIAEAFAALWPILLTVGGGYGFLLFYIRKQFEDRLKEKDERITDLTKRLDRREEYVWRTLSATETATALAATSLAAAGEQRA